MSKIVQVLLRRRQVEARTGLPRSTLYRLISEDRFPTPVSIGTRSVAWIEAEIDEWINEQIDHARSADRTDGGKISSGPKVTIQDGHNG